MIKPTGYYVLVEMEDAVPRDEGDFLLPKEFLEREQNGYDIGVVKAFGPTCFTGFKGINDSDSLIDRAKKYGVKIGDRVEFNRYDGKTPRDPALEGMRLIQDEHIIGVYV